MKTLLVPLISLGFLLGPSLWAQPELDKKPKDAEKKLTAEQKQLLDEYVDLRFRWGVRASTANQGVFSTLPEVRKVVLDELAAMPAAQAKKFWRELPKNLKRGFRDLDPLHVLAEERKAADRLPAEAKAEVAKLLSDDLDKVLAARRKVLAYGPACRALVVDQVSKLAANSPQRMRHLDILAKLELEEIHDKRMRITETALVKAAKLEKTRGKTASTIAVLVARNLCDLGQRHDPYGRLSYYNFIYSNHDYKEGAGLCFGNGGGNPLGINFWTTQDNRLSSLGAVKFADVKKAPGPAATAKWWRDDRNGPRMTAVVGDTYLLHVFDPRDKTDFTVKFRVLDLSDDEWIIIEWQRIPQEK